MEQSRLLAALLSGAVLVCAAPPAQAGPHDPYVVLTVPWGSGPGQVGRSQGEEAAPEGPMSFRVDRHGGLWILDQVNRRVLHVDASGRARDAVPLQADTYQDLLLTDHGDLIVVDRLARRAADWLSRSGALRRSIPVEGAHLPEGGGVTAAFFDSAGLWLEWNNQVTVRVADPTGNAVAERTAVVGRPFPAAGVRTGARLAGPTSIELYTAGLADDVLRAHAQVTLPARILEIVDLQVTANGRVVLAVHLLQAGVQPPWSEPHETIDVLVLSPRLHELSRFSLPPTQGPWEQHRTLHVTPEGAVYHARCGPAGLEVRRWDP